MAQIPEIYRCPSFDGAPTLTTYVAFVGEDACFAADRPRPLSEFTRATSDIAMLIDISPAAAVPWMAPQDGGVEFLLNFGTDTPMPHESVTNAAYANGHVQTLGDRSPEERRSLISIHTGEPPPNR